MATATAQRVDQQIAKQPKCGKRDRARFCAEHLVMLALGKACYKHSDVLQEFLLLHIKPEHRIRITRQHLGRKVIARMVRKALALACSTIEGKTYQVSDKFANRNSIPVGQNARRFEFKEVQLDE